MSDLDTRPVALVLGANGHLGSAAVAAFAAAGWQVVAQRRRVPPQSPPPGVVETRVPLGDTAALAAAAAGARVVVHAVNPPYPDWAARAMPMLRDGIAVARRLGATLMLPGNVYNFGERMPPLLTEHTPQQPTSAKGRIRQQMEELLRTQAGQGDLRVAVVRAGDFLGGGPGGWLDQMIVRSLARGRLAYPGPLDVPHAWAWLPDLATVFVEVAGRAGRLPAFVDLPFAGYTLTGGELLDAIERAASALGVTAGRAGPLRRGGVPWPLIRAAGWFVPMMREIHEMAYLWRVPHALDGAALARTIGPVTVTPLDVAMTRSLAQLGFAATRPQPAVAH